jgi:hypothetical protein
MYFPLLRVITPTSTPNSLKGFWALESSDENVQITIKI